MKNIDQNVYDDEDEHINENMKKISFEEALDSAKVLLEFFSQNQKSSKDDIIYINRIIRSLKLCNKKPSRQIFMDEFLK